MKEVNIINTCTHASLSFVMKHRDPKSSNDKLTLSYSIVARFDFRRSLVSGLPP